MGACYDKKLLKNLKDKNEIYRQMITPLKNGRQRVLEDGELTMGGYTMKFCYRIIGSIPQRGFPLIFGLHGGGGCD